MSLCKGRIFLGSSGIVVDEVEFSKKHVDTDLWDENIEKKILEKIKNKAFEQARSIVQDAQKQAIQIRNDAYEQGYKEGYKKGMAKAHEEIEKIKKDTAAKLITIVNNIENEKKKIFEKYIDEILKLIFISVEKLSDIVFVEQKKAVIKDILEDCLQEIDNSSQVKIFVNEQDYPLIKEIIEEIKCNYPDIKKWDISVKQGLSSGSVQIDTGTSMVEDAFLKRKEKLMEIIKNISLEEEYEDK